MNLSNRHQHNRLSIRISRSSALESYPAQEKGYGQETD